MLLAVHSLCIEVRNRWDIYPYLFAHFHVCLCRMREWKRRLLKFTYLRHSKRADFLLHLLCFDCRLLLALNSLFIPRSVVFSFSGLYARNAVEGVNFVAMSILRFSWKFSLIFWVKFFLDFSSFTYFLEHSSIFWYIVKNIFINFPQFSDFS